MNAIRRDEELDELHSLYVDQRDREYVISREERTFDTLKAKATLVYEALKSTAKHLAAKFPALVSSLPEKLYFITTQELEDLYPTSSPKEREDLICREHKAVFLMQIGDELKSGTAHDGRAPDYDDRKLNGDLLVYYPLMDKAFEISSMGIRVDETSLVEQLAKR
jgi:aspartate--ammonia ligase